MVLIPAQELGDAHKIITLVVNRSMLIVDACHAKHA